MSHHDEINPADLPQETFKQKEIFQHPQPADQGKPLDKEDNKDNSLHPAREHEKTSKEEGLNEVNSSGTAGAFEGFEDQQKD